MKKFVLFFLFTLLLIIGCILLMPRNYHTPDYKSLRGSQTWILKDGSHINYFLLKAAEPVLNKTIVYLHGGPGGCITKALIIALQKFADEGYDVYMYDQIGSGSSSRLTDINAYSVARHTADLGEIIGKIGADKCILLAHSWGTLLAINYLTEDNSKVEKVILTGPGPILPIDPSLRNLTPPDSLHLRNPLFTNAAGSIDANNYRVSFIAFCAERFGWKLASDEEMDHFFTYLNTKLSRSTYCDTSLVKPSAPGGGYYAHIMTVNSFKDVEDDKSRLKNLNIPVLILRGQCDNQKWGFVTEYLSLLKNVQLKIIPEAGHSLVLEQPELFYKYALDFLSQPL